MSAAQQNSAETNTHWTRAPRSQLRPNRDEPGMRNCNMVPNACIERITTAALFSRRKHRRVYQRPILPSNCECRSAFRVCVRTGFDEVSSNHHRWSSMELSQDLCRPAPKKAAHQHVELAFDFWMLYCPHDPEISEHVRQNRRATVPLNQ